MVDRSRNRSDSYQYILLETYCAPELLTEYSDARGLTGMLNDSEQHEKMEELKIRLKEAFWRIVDTQLTTRQRQVLRLSSEGNTQVEIAKMLGVNQSSITKSIHGNCDYRNGRKVYGGAKKKILKIVEKDEDIQQIFREMQELSSEL